MLNPTDEQAAADHFHAGDHLALQAGAGTGKTTTLALLAQGTKRRGRYLTYNRAIARDAATRFPTTVTCKTAHAPAFAAIGHRYTRRLNAPRRPAWQTGQDLGITKPVRIGDHELSQRTLSNAGLRIVTHYCHSADPTITHHHVPRLRGLEEQPRHSQLAQLSTPFARKAWADLQGPDDGKVRFEHDHYLKIWSLTDPKIAAGFLLLDEAQDTNPVVEQIFNNQRSHAQLVMVGDSAQAIYQWRGAKDVMTGFDGTALALSKSFRFGPASPTKPTAGSLSPTHPSACKAATKSPPQSAPSHNPTQCCAEPTSEPSPKSSNSWTPTTVSPWSGEGRACAPWPWQPATSRKAAAPTTPNSYSSPPGATSRTTPAMTRQGATCSHWSTSWTNTAQTPSSPQSTNSLTKSAPRSPYRPRTRPRDVNGPP